MKREFLTTGDGSITIHLPEWNEQYHSKHGAVVEGQHVFVDTGLRYWVGQNPDKVVSVLEIGFGTGLNAFLTLIEASKKNLQIEYTAVEAYPVLLYEIKQLNYPEILGASEEDFLKIHTSEWELTSEITTKFQLLKRKLFLSEIDDSSVHDLIYFDAFCPRVQPDLWTEKIFRKMFSVLRPGGVLVTYSAKGIVRRAMQAAGFVVERLPGPPGKREMLRALKN